MHDNKFTFPGLLVVFLFTVTSCCKDSDIPQPWPPPDDELESCIEGKSGTTTLVLTAVHHTDTIPGQPTYPDTAYIKFNTSEFPGDDASLYDLVVAGTFPDTSIVIDSMSCGNYYIFMTGFDVSIAERVKGGIPVVIHDEDVLLNIKVPVTED